MRLNTLKPAEGSKPAKTRVGRGIGSGLGKTCGRGHKGQHARAGGYHKVGFEGGQMPLQRRLPKFGFNSRKARVTSEITLAQLAQLDTNEFSLATLHDADLFSHAIKHVKVIAARGDFKLDRAITVNGLKVTQSVREQIEKAGGKVVSE